MDQISVDYKQDMSFVAHVENFTIDLDASVENGGNDSSMRPKPLMLVALAGCTGMDIASLARKMRVEIEKLTIDASAEKSEEMPVVYTSVQLTYNFTAKEEYRDKILKMVDMSQERYCGVAAMMRTVCPLNYTVVLNGEGIEKTI